MGETPRLTGPEDPLNQFEMTLAPALIFGCEAVDSMTLLDGMKLARDLVGLGNEALEVCCCIVDVARVAVVRQLSKKVSVSERWCRGE